MSNANSITSNDNDDVDGGETFEVHVAIYDLSRGMARSLSGQFLGPQYAIDAIPHTGIVVYGLEYFFGAGIQSEEPQAFRQSTGMFPFQTILLGRTRKNRRQFEQWCMYMRHSGQYTHASYDFLLRNCNNFSHDAAILGLGLSRGVPDWVLDVPQRFLSSPMGQMVRPILETMQLGNVAGADHIGQARTTTTTAALPPTTSTTPAATVISNPTAENYNPWLNNVAPPPPPPPLPSSATNAAAPAETTPSTPVSTSDNPWAAAVADPPPPPPPTSRPSSLSSAPPPPPPPPPPPKFKNTNSSTAAVTAFSPPPPPPPPPPPRPNPSPKSKHNTNSNTDAAAKRSPSSSTTTTPLLDSFTKPLLSTETKTLPLCVNKITATIIPQDSSVGATLQQEQERSALLQAQAVLSKHSTSITTMNETLAETIGQILLKSLQRSEKNAMHNPENVAVLPFVLMMLRIAVLKMPPPATNTNESSSLEACLQWVERNLLLQKEEDGTKLSPVARAMAWLTVSNAYCGGSLDNAATSIGRRDALVEAAMAEINPDFESRHEVRQAASAFLYNVALLLLSTKDGDALPDLHISILCATLEDVASEVDATTRLRRLMAAGRILQPIVTHAVMPPDNSNNRASSPRMANGAAAGSCDELPTTALTNTVAKQLALDLGFAEALQAIMNAAKQDKNSNHCDQSNVNCHKLAAELLHVLNS